MFACEVRVEIAILISVNLQTLFSGIDKLDCQDQCTFILKQTGVRIQTYLISLLVFSSPVFLLSENGMLLEGLLAAS